MELYKIFLAYQAIQTLTKLNLPYDKTMKLLKLREKMKLSVELYVNEEGKIIERFQKAKKLRQEGGKLIFSISGDVETDEKNAKEYIELVGHLRKTQIDWCGEIIDIDKSEMENPDIPNAYQRISGECIENLKDFVEFGGD